MLRGIHYERYRVTMAANPSAKSLEANVWEEWRSRLRDPALPAAVAYYFARNGSVDERFELTCNDSLPLDAVLALVEDPHEAVFSGVVSCPSITADLLHYAVGLHPELKEVASGEPNAGLPTKFGISLEKTTTRSLLKFFQDVRADESERSLLLSMFIEHPQITLGEAWKSVRTA
jgi:hypothetical protein